MFATGGSDRDPREVSFLEEHPIPPFTLLCYILLAAISSSFNGNAFNDCYLINYYHLCVHSISSSQQIVNYRVFYSHFAFNDSNILRNWIRFLKSSALWLSLFLFIHFIYLLTHFSIWNHAVNLSYFCQTYPVTSSPAQRKTLLNGTFFILEINRNVEEGMGCGIYRHNNRQSEATRRACLDGIRVECSGGCIVDRLERDIVNVTKCIERDIV